MTPSRHRGAPIGGYIPETLRDDANQVLDTRGRSRNSFLTACLTALVHDPDPLLSLLEPHWPEQRYGRPPRER